MIIQLGEFNLRDWRKKMSLTQGEVALELGVSHRQVQNWEAHKSPLDRRSILACLYIEKAMVDTAAKGNSV